MTTFCYTNKLCKFVISCYCLASHMLENDIFQKLTTLLNCFKFDKCYQLAMANLSISVYVMRQYFYLLRIICIYLH